MKLTHHLVLVSVLSTVSASTAALDLSASTYVKYFDYQEFDLDGSSLNHETGFIPGIGLTLDHDKHRLWASWTHGDVNYDGQLQSGTPHVTDTRQVISSYGYEYAFFTSNSTAIDILAGISAHRWQRHILPSNGIQGVNADYQWQQLYAGLRYKPGEIFNLPLEFGLNIFQTRKSSVDINLESIGYGSPQLEMGEKPGFQATLKYYKAVSDQLTVNLLLETARRETGRSSTVSISNGTSTLNIAEPESVSWHTNIGISLEYRL